MFVKLPGNRVVLLVECYFHCSFERADTKFLENRSLQSLFLFTLDSIFFFFEGLNLAGFI